MNREGLTMHDRANKSERRGFLKALGLGAAAAASTVATAEAQGTALAPAPAKETEQQKVATRYRESDHVKAYYRTNRYEH
jgi:nitrous oxide reductase